VDDTGFFEDVKEFSLDVEFESELAEGGVPNNLRTEFWEKSAKENENRISLSTNATIGSQDGRTWVITDPKTQKYLVKKASSKISVHQQIEGTDFFAESQLFEIEPDFPIDQETDEEISDDLRREFWKKSATEEDQRILLSDDTTIRNVDDENWVITEQKEVKYGIRKAEGELAVHKGIAKTNVVDLLEHSDLRVGMDSSLLSVSPLPVPLFRIPEFGIEFATGFYRTPIEFAQDFEPRDVWSWYFMPSVMLRIIDGKHASFGGSAGLMYLTPIDDFIKLSDDGSWENWVIRFQTELRIHPGPFDRDKSIFLRGVYYFDRLESSANNIISVQVGYSTPISRINL
jgi:hypothetical protein